MAKNRYRRTYRYKCGITGKEIKVTREAPNPDELMSVEAYYQLNPEEDDRKESEMARLGLDKEIELSASETTEDSEEEESESISE